MIYYTRNTRCFVLWVRTLATPPERVLQTHFVTCVIFMGVRVIMLMVDWLWIWRCFPFPLDRAISFLFTIYHVFCSGSEWFIYSKCNGWISSSENKLIHWSGYKQREWRQKLSQLTERTKKLCFHFFYLSFCANVKQIQIQDHPKYIRISNRFPFPLL